MSKEIENGIDDVLDDVIEDEESQGDKKEKDKDLLNTYFSSENYKKLDNEIWVSAKFLVNGHSKGDTLVKKTIHPMFFNGNIDGMTGDNFDISSKGIKYCCKEQFKDNKYCPWDAISYNLWNYNQTYPNNEYRDKFEYIRKSMNSKDEIYVNVFILDSNLEEIDDLKGKIIGRTFKFRIAVKAIYKDYIIETRKGKKKKKDSKGGFNGPNVFSLSHPPAYIKAVKEGNNAFERQWSARDDDEYSNSSFEEILNSEFDIGLDDIETFSLKEYKFENDEYIDEELRNDVDSYISKQYEEAKEWIAFNIPEIIPVAKNKFIKEINPDDYFEDDDSDDYIDDDEEFDDSDDEEFEDSGDEEEFDDSDDGDLDDELLDLDDE